MDSGKPQSGTPTANISVRRPAEAGSESPFSGSPAASFIKPHFSIFQYGGIFRSAQSCTNLEGMVPQDSASASGSTVDLSVDTTDHATLGVPGGKPGGLHQPCPSEKKLPYGGMFRTVKSCANLETLVENSAQGDGAAQVHQESGLLFGGLKSYLAKSNMVSAKDLNVFAPMSS